MTSEPTIVASSAVPYGTCGLGLFYNFFKTDDLSWDTPLKRKANQGGAGYAVAGFIDTPECKEAYEILAKRFKIVYQSEVRENSNSGNDFFFVVYDTK